MQGIKIALSLIFLGSVFTASSQFLVGVQAGQKYKVESSINLNSSAEVMGQSMVTEVDTKTTTLFKVTHAGPDSIGLQHTITYMKVNSNAMGQELTFDSDEKDNSGPLAETLSKKLNRTSSVTLDPRGNIIRQDKEEESAGDASLGLGDPNATSIELFIPALSGRELKEGVSFTDQGSVKKEKYSSRDSGTYTITSIQNGVASISYTGTQEINSTIEQMGMEMTTNSVNSVKSTIVVDIYTGIVRSRTMETESAITIDAGGMTIPATGKTTVTTKISQVQ